MTDPHPRPPVDCPVCGLGLTVSRLTCEACGTELTGRFTPCPLCSLSDDELALVQGLMAAGGDLDAAAHSTGIGVDVLRQRLRLSADRLGLAPPPESPRPAAPYPDASDASDASDEGNDFLQRLAHGVVEADEALRHLP